MTHNHNAIWSRADLDKMLKMAEAGYGSARIGLELGRTKAAVSVALCNERKRIRNAELDAAPEQDPSGGTFYGCTSFTNETKLCDQCRLPY